MINQPGASGEGGWIGAWAFKSYDFDYGWKLRFNPIPTVKTNESGHYGTASASAYAVSDDHIFTQVNV